MSREIVKVGLALIRDGSVLLVRKRGTRYWILPGGKPDPGESWEQALAREVSEEIACELRLDTLEFLGEFTDVAANEPDTIVRVPLYSGEITGSPSPCAEIDAQCWYPADASVEADLSPVLARRIVPALRERRLL